MLRFFGEVLVLAAIIFSVGVGSVMLVRKLTATCEEAVVLSAKQWQCTDSDPGVGCVEYRKQVELQRPYLQIPKRKEHAL